MPSQAISVLLEGGDRRSIGRSNEVAKRVLRTPRRFAELLQCLWSRDAIVRMRAADAAEKVSSVKPELLEPHKAELLGLLAESQQSEVRWHLAQMIPRLPLHETERQRAAKLLESYLEDPSSIVRTFTLEALADLSRRDAGLRQRLREILAESLDSGTAAMKARARKLLKQLRNWNA